MTTLRINTETSGQLYDSASELVWRDNTANLCQTTSDREMLLGGHFEGLSDYLCELSEDNYND